MKPETKAQIRAAISGGEANQPLLENASRWLLELLAEDDRREALDHTIDPIPGDTLENMRMFVNGGIPGYCDHPGHDDVEDWIGALLAERDRAAGIILAIERAAEIEAIAAGAPPGTLEASEVIACLAREVLKARADAASFMAQARDLVDANDRHRARAEQLHAVAALVDALDVGEVPADVERRDPIEVFRWALRELVAARAAAAEVARTTSRESFAALVIRGLENPTDAQRAALRELSINAGGVGVLIDAGPEPVKDELIDQVRAALLARTPGTWTARGSAVLVPFGDPQMSPDFLRYAEEERAGDLARHRERWDAMSDDERAEHAAAGWTRDTVLRSTSDAIGGDLVCESIGAADAALVAGAPVWLERLIAERAELLAELERRRGKPDSATLPAVDAPPASATLGATAFDHPASPAAIRAQVLEQAIEADPIMREAAAARVDEVTTPARCPDGLLGLLLPPWRPEVEQAIDDARGMRADVERWRRDPAEIARAKADLADLEAALERAEVVEPPPTRCAMCGAPDRERCGHWIGKL